MTIKSRTHDIRLMRWMIPHDVQRPPDVNPLGDGGGLAGGQQAVEVTTQNEVDLKSIGLEDIGT